LVDGILQRHLLLLEEDGDDDDDDGACCCECSEEACFRLVDFGTCFESKDLLLNSESPRLLSLLLVAEEKTWDDESTRSLHLALLWEGEGEDIMGGLRLEGTFGDCFTPSAGGGGPHLLLDLARTGAEMLDFKCPPPHGAE